LSVVVKIVLQRYGKVIFSGFRAYFWRSYLLIFRNFN
jgi:hypothetical protein